MNVFLLTDLEGISGVVSIDAVDRTHPAYAEACRLLERSINRVGGLCIERGAEHVYYLDGHGGGGNADEKNIDPRLIKTTIDGWQDLLAAGKIDLQIELGAHARAGTTGGFLDHTMNSRQWFRHTVNGMEMSELSMHALVCGAHNVPVAAVIGDRAACEQAREYIPNIYTAVVKTAERRNECKIEPDADEQIEKAVSGALAGYREIAPYRMDGPLDVRLTFYRTDFCEDALERSPEARRLDARTLQRSVWELKRYEDLKF